MTAGGQRIFVAEPPAAWLVRPSIVVDCSVFGALAFGEPTQATARQHLAGKSMHAPHLLDHEMASVAMKKLRAGTSAERVTEGLDLYLSADIAFHRAAPDTVVPLADAYALSADDAAYLALAAALRVPLVTFDRKLGEAAEAHLRSLG